MNPFDKLEIIKERHLIGDKIKIIKKVYILEELMQRGSQEELKLYFKEGLHAKKILKFQRDECSFRWVVWYI